MEESFFCGDAAGREKDHSDADSGFARACGLAFFTETEFFAQNRGPLSADAKPDPAPDVDAAMHAGEGAETSPVSGRGNEASGSVGAAEEGAAPVATDAT